MINNTNNDGDEIREIIENALAKPESSSDKTAFNLGVLASHIESSNKISKAYEIALDSAIESIKNIDQLAKGAQDKVKVRELRNDLAA